MVKKLRTASLNLKFIGSYKKVYSLLNRVSNSCENRLNQCNGTETYHSVCYAKIVVELKHKEFSF